MSESEEAQEPTDLAKQLALLFESRGYSWRVKDDDGNPGYITPDEYDIQAVLDRAEELLYDEESESQVDVGRLLFRKIDGKNIEVYPLFGVLGE